MTAPVEPHIPAPVRQIYDAIVRLTDAFCQAHLAQEYQEICRRLASILASHQPSPLLRGKPEVWACGILRVIGRVNFLDIDTGRRPFMTLTTIDKRFGVSSNTGQTKAKTIRDMLHIRPFDLDWTLPSLRDRHVRRRMLSYALEIFEVLDREEEQAVLATVPSWR